MTIKRLLRRISVLILCVSLTQFAFSQTKVITGTISDDKGQPVQGASVSVKGTKGGTTTDASGAFSLSAPASAKTLVVSSVGFNQQEVDISDKTAVTVSLVASSQSLNDVVVIGYGTSRKKDVTGSLVSLKAKDFNQGVINSPDALLQNKVAGLDITSNTGQPGAQTTIKIRGNNTIRTGNNPLYVLDGVPLDGRTARPNIDFGTSGLGFGASPEDNPLLYINPYDIAQIDVLKDAAATAIYGSRGANGIIVITTKRASAGPTKLEFGTQLGTFAGYMKPYKILTASQFRQESLDNHLVQDSGASVNAMQEITQQTLTQNYSLALSGGNDNGKFRASFLGSSIQGYIKKTSLDKYLATFYGSYNFLDKRLVLDFNVIAGHTTENMALLSSTTGAGGNMLSWALNWNPTRALVASNGLYNNSPSADFQVPNPLAAIAATSDVANVDVVMANMSATVKILNNLDYKFLYSINHGTGVRNTNIDGWLQGVQGVTGQGYGAISNTVMTTQDLQQTLTYHTNITQNLKFEALGGFEYWKTDYSTQSLAATGFRINQDQATVTGIKYTSFMSNASQQFPLTPIIDPTAEIQSYFARVTFNQSDKYYLTGTIRADGSNKFGANNKYGYFPSVAAKWVISNEDFMKNDQTVSNLGLRVSWGITGNQEFPSGASLEQVVSGSYPQANQANVSNPNLKWEQTTTFDIGLDYGLANGKIFGSFDYYHKTTTNILFQSNAIQPAPSALTFINIPANINNDGFEFSIGAPIITKKDFSWDLSFNIAYNQNKLTNFNQAPIYTGKVNGNGVSGALAQIITNNQPVDEFYLKQFSGFNQAGQQIIADTASFQGDPNPHVVSGFSTTLRYKKLTLTLNAGGNFGFSIYNNTLNTITNIAPFSTGQNTASQNFGTGESIGDGAVASSRYVENGSFIKLRNATFTYTFGDVGKYLKNFNVYVSGTNLFVITKFTGFDPEVNTDQNNNSYPSRSMEYLPYPTARIITFGLNFAL